MPFILLPRPESKYKLTVRHKDKKWMFSNSYVIMAQQMPDELAAGARGGVSVRRAAQVGVRVLVGRRLQVVHDTTHPRLVPAVVEVQ